MRTATHTALMVVNYTATISHQCCYCGRPIWFKSSTTNKKRSGLRGAVFRLHQMMHIGGLERVQRGTWDHVIPRGQVIYTPGQGSNLVECCDDCNQSKGGKGLLFWLLSRR